MEEREQSRYEDELLELLQGGAGRRQQRPLFRRPGQDLQYSPSEQDSALTTAPSRTSLPDTVRNNKLLNAKPDKWVQVSSEIWAHIFRPVLYFKIFVVCRSS